MRHTRLRSAKLLESGGQVLLCFVVLGIELESLLKRGDGSLDFALQPRSGSLSPTHGKTSLFCNMQSGRRSRKREAG